MGVDSANGPKTRPNVPTLGRLRLRPLYKIRSPRLDNWSAAARHHW